MPLTITQPVQEDADKLTRFILKSKRHWKYPDDWFEIWKDELRITPEDIRTRHFYMGQSEHDMVFVYSIKPLKNSTWELEDCWVAPDYIGKGYGNTLFNHMIGTLISLKCKTLTIVSEPFAEGFYLKMGARRVGEKESRIRGRFLPILEYQVETE